MGGGYEKPGDIATFAAVTVDRKSVDVKVVRVCRVFTGTFFASIIVALKCLKALGPFGAMPSFLWHSSGSGKTWPKRPMTRQVTSDLNFTPVTCSDLFQMRIAP
jgi:hypothetical protein